MLSGRSASDVRSCQFYVTVSWTCLPPVCCGSESPLGAETEPTCGWLGACTQVLQVHDPELLTTRNLLPTVTALTVSGSECAASFRGF